MAQVARDLQSRPDIDYHLDYQLREWQSVPEYAESWAEMDASQKEVFHLEWVGITESRLQQLQQWADQGLLTPTQRRRYQRLLKLVQEHRPTIGGLLNE